jgi:amidohydrolase
MDIKSKADALKDELVKIRRHIHQHPELGMKEYKTTKLVKEELKKAGVQIKDIRTETGVLAIIKGEKKGPNIVTALRGDMDALPIKEMTGLDYASQNEGIMHACGHDGHTTMLLGAAKLLNTMKDQFSGTVKFIFQPSEETLLGARSMVEAGVLEDPAVDNILGLHDFPAVEVGKIAFWRGPYMASADKFTVKVIGFGGHGAYPHKSTDSLLAASTAVVQFQNIVSRQIDALEKAVISVCMINGGKTFNVIPEEVSFCGTVRCHNNEVRMGIKDKMEIIMKGIATSFGVKYELDYEWGVPPVVNDPEVVDAVIEAAKKVLGEDKVEQLKNQAMSSEDFSIYLEKVPKGAFIRVGITNPGEKPLVLHNDHFNFNDDAIPVGVSLFTQYVLDQNNK